MIYIALKVVGNPDPRNPTVKMGSYLAGEPLGENDHVAISALNTKHAPCKVLCPDFDLNIDAVLSTSSPYRYDGVILQTASLIPDAMIDFVDCHPLKLIAEVTVIPRTEP